MIRALDIAAAVVGGLLGTPILVILAVLVRIDSPGPAIFSQVRVGQYERPFICFKLRTMAVGTKHAGTHEVSTAAVTRIGSWLRKTKLDELPQLWNVLWGEMSLVGPRPNLPSQTEVIAERRKHGIYAARPGITGPAQLLGVDMSMPARLAEVDAVWVEAPSVRAYLAYIARTMAGGGRGDRVRRA